MKGGTVMNKTTIAILGLAAVAIVAAISYAQEQQGVSISRGEITIPTYPWGPDDINPYFRWVSPGGYSPTLTIYPYQMQDNLSKTKVDKTYKTMVLENTYLKVTVIPELGGHIHSVLDKVTGENMLYENKVLKPALIGLRGAWTSGGIEFNTGPQGHTVTCLSPVEATFVDYDDGSKAIAIGNVEQVYHTQWVAIVRLRPGRSFLEEHIRIYNPTGNKQLYYFWNCVAMPNTKETQFIYPMTLGSDHWGKTFFNWPIHEGRDISWLKNFKGPTSVFAYRCDQDFYGSYDHNLDRGVITSANHFELIGKKSWTWSTSQWGLRAQESLTDDGTLYNEIQTGPLQTQADYGILEPHQTVEWDEWWYPVRGTKGVTYSNKNVTVNVQKDENNKTITVLLHGTGAWDTVCSIKDVGEQRVKITPESPVSTTFQYQGNMDKFQVTILSDKEVLSKFTFPLQLPKRTPPDNPRELPSEDTAAGCWLIGISHDKEGGTHLAQEWYAKAVKKDVDFAPAYTSLGELELEAGQYTLAREHLEKSIKLNPDDGMAAYYLAQVLLEQGFVDDALETTYQAVRRPESTGPAYNLAGSILMRQGEFGKALDPLRKAVNFNPRDIASRNLLAYALWKVEDKNTALQELKEVQAQDPLDMPSGVIQWLINKDDTDCEERISGRKEEILDIADFFVTSGLKQVAIDAIERYYLYTTNRRTRQELDPMPYYYHGILTNNTKSLAKAFELSPDNVFPNRRSDFMILEEVVKRQPNDWKARYYLGNLYFERCRKEDAVKVWKEAIALNDSYSVLHRNLGLVAWKIDKNLWIAIQHYENALKANPDDLTLYRDLGRLYSETNQHIKVKEVLEKTRGKKLTRADITVLLGRAYLQLGEYENARDLLAADSYINWEGQGSLYGIYTALHIGLGERLFQKGDYAEALKEFKLSIEYPKNLGPGQIDNPPEAETYYWIGMSLEKLGKKDEAIEAWKRATEQAEHGDDRNRKFAREAMEKLK